MKLLAITFLVIAAVGSDVLAQVAEKTILDTNADAQCTTATRSDGKTSIGECHASNPKETPAFTHEQKDALKDAAIQSLVAEKQVANAQKAADSANAAYINLLNQMLAKIGCAGGQVDLSFAVACPSK